MYWFGENIGKTGKWMDESAWMPLSQKKRALQETALNEIIELLDSFGKKWENESSLISDIAFETGLSAAEVSSTLDLLPKLLSRESLERRVRGEFHQPAILDGFAKTHGFSGRVKAQPLGILLHVTAGNVFISCIDSLIMGFLTKNLSILKVSSSNLVFPHYFSEKLQAFDTESVLADKFAILSWKGGEKSPEDFLKRKVQAIVAWGGEEMISSYKRDLPLGVKLLDFGPKVSLQVITKEGLKDTDHQKVAQKIVQDIIPWDQSACSSPQNLYLQAGIEESFLLEVHKAFNQAAPRGILSDDEATEILKEKYRGHYSEAMKEGMLLEGREHLIHLEKEKGLRPSPLNRSLIVKKFSDAEELAEILKPLSFYLQSCSYLVGEGEREQYLNELSAAGMKRFAPLGTITWGMDGAPHDGRMVLRELVHLIGDEFRAVDYGAKSEELQTSADMKKIFESTEHPRGYIFSSGGTTGEPKYVHFSYEEFDYVTDMLAENFRAQGLHSGMLVANLFVAGNLWSSFLAVEKALEKVGVVQLPIGGLCAQENIATYLNKFKPAAIMGIPSLLVSLAEYMESRSMSLQISRVFYAGEALSESRMQFLKSIWRIESFGSAGYASVDAGVIGYQCAQCKPGEHHLFSDLVQMNIVDDEAVVSSFYRTSMPIRHYRTGDRVRWIPECSCGSSDPRFQLLGRIDNLIQIWSCRILLEDIESALKECSDVKTYQVILTEENGRESLSLYYEAMKPLPEEKLITQIYHHSRDVKDSLSREEFSQRVRLVSVESGLIPRNPRTGKISLIVDKR